MGFFFARRPKLAGSLSLAQVGGISGKVLRVYESKSTSYLKSDILWYYKEFKESYIQFFDLKINHSTWKQAHFIYKLRNYKEYKYNKWVWEICDLKI